MKTEATKLKRGVQLTIWTICISITCGVIFVGSVLIKPTLFSNEKISRRLAMVFYCPGASLLTEGQSTLKKAFNNPSEMYAMCLFWNGREESISNEEYLLVYIGWMLGSGPLCGVGISIPVLLFVFRKKRKSNNVNLLPT
jgi:hypothetical protein